MVSVQEFGIIFLNNGSHSGNLSCCSTGITCDSEIIICKFIVCCQILISSGSPPIGELFASFAQLPPSNTTSGFNGHCASHLIEVVLAGLISPAGALGPTLDGYLYLWLLFVCMLQRRVHSRIVRIMYAFYNISIRIIDPVLSFNITRRYN